MKSGSTSDRVEWSTAHGDLHWASLTAPDCWLLGGKHGAPHLLVTAPLLHAVILTPTSARPTHPRALLAVLDRLEQWLAGAGEPAAVEACALACSLGESDALSVAAWLGALATRLQHRIEEADSWS